MPKVSIITPAYNAERFIVQTVESILAQTFQDFEYIVVDDGSSDNTRALLQPYIDASKLTYVYQDNAERAVARNNGVHHAAGEYVAFIDADDLWPPDKLQLQVDVLDAHPEVSVVYGQTEYIDELGQPTTYIGISRSGADVPETLIQDQSRALMNGDVIGAGGSCVMTRRALLVQLGGFDTSLNYGEDWEMWIRLSRLGLFASIPKTLLLYRLFGPNKILKAETSDRVIEQHLRVIDKSLRDWPDDTAEREQLRQRALATYHRRVALYAYQSHKLEQGRTHLARAIELDASIGQRMNLVQLAVDRATLIERESHAMEPVRVFINEFFANLPAYVAQFGTAAKSALGWYYIGRAFDEFRQGQLADARRWVWAGIRHAPDALTNRGVLSVAARSLIGKNQGKGGGN